MNFDFTDEQKQFAQQGTALRARTSGQGCAQACHDPRFPFDVAEIVAKRGLMGGFGGGLILIF